MVDLPDMPARIARLPRDHRGYPVPRFVAWIDGAPDFRVIRENAIADCVNGRRCWLCGDHLGANVAFVIGPMCAVNRVSAEPPSHRDCAKFAAKACPFLTRPHMRRREGNLPDDAVLPAGHMIARNPGVSLIWVTRASRVRLRPAPGGFLFDVGEPTATLWYAEGREATRDEAQAAIDSGLPLLRDLAEQEGTRAVKQLERQLANAVALLPPAELAEATR